MSIWDHLNESLNGDELKLLFFWIGHCYDTPLLRLAYNNARNADFDRSGVAHGITSPQDLGNYPFNDGVLEIYRALKRSIENHDPTEFTEYMQNKPMNWRNVRWVNTILSINNIEL